MKKIIYFLLFLTMFDINAKASLAAADDSQRLGTNFAAQNSEADMAKLTEKKVVMVIAEKDFRDEEFFQPKEALQKAGVKVDVACANIRQAKGSLGATVIPNMLVSDINITDYDAVIFIGGAGCRQYWNDPKALAVIKEADRKEKIIGGICSAAATLALAGILEGKNATVFPTEAQVLKDNGANYTGKSVEVDGNIVTADGPMSAKAFGEALVKKLSE